MVAVIVFGVIGLTLLTISVFTENDDTKPGAFVYGIVIMVLLLLIVCVFFWDGTYEKGQKDALKGIQNYEIQHVYRVNDTIPVDTLYVKITSK